MTSKKSVLPQNRAPRVGTDDENHEMKLAQVGDEVFMTTYHTKGEDDDTPKTCAAGTLVSDAKLPAKELESLRMQGLVLPANQETVDGINRKRSAAIVAKREYMVSSLNNEHAAARESVAREITGKHQTAADEELGKALEKLNAEQKKEMDALVNSFVKDDSSRK